VQIEKFIESIFPSQNAEEVKRRVKGELTKEEQERKQEDEESKQDVYFMMALMGAVIFFVAFSMVCTCKSDVILGVY
jgi:farnesyl-diphosphate farnesyltransferase